MKKTMKYYSFCGRELVNPNLFRLFCSNKHQLNTGTKTKWNMSRKVYNTEDKSHECPFVLIVILRWL